MCCICDTTSARCKKVEQSRHALVSSTQSPQDSQLPSSSPQSRSAASPQHGTLTENVVRSIVPDHRAEVAAVTARQSAGALQAAGHADPERPAVFASAVAGNAGTGRQVMTTNQFDAGDACNPQHWDCAGCWCRCIGWGQPERWQSRPGRQAWTSADHCDACLRCGGPELRSKRVDPHSGYVVLIGAMWLWFGWFAFNAASVFTMRSGADTQTYIIITVVTNTLLSSTAGVVVQLLHQRFFRSLTLCGGRGADSTPSHDAYTMSNSLLAALVAITAPCAFVLPWHAAVIGGVAFYVFMFASHWLRVVGIDDPLEAFPVHGAAGIWGLLSVGLFAQAENIGMVIGYASKPVCADDITEFGLFYGGGAQLLAKQLELALLIAVWSGTVASIMFVIMARLGTLRISSADEVRGVDFLKYGVSNFPQFVLRRTGVHGEQNARPETAVVAARTPSEHGQFGGSHKQRARTFSSSSSSSASGGDGGGQGGAAGSASGGWGTAFSIQHSHNGQSNRRVGRRSSDTHRHHGRVASDLSLASRSIDAPHVEGAGGAVWSDAQGNVPQRGPQRVSNQPTVYRADQVAAHTHAMHGYRGYNYGGYATGLVPAGGLAPALLPGTPLSPYTPPAAMMAPDVRMPLQWHAHGWDPSGFAQAPLRPARQQQGTPGRGGGSITPLNHSNTPGLEPADATRNMGAIVRGRNTPGWASTWGGSQAESQAYGGGAGLSSPGRDSTYFQDGVWLARPQAAVPAMLPASHLPRQKAAHRLHSATGITVPPSESPTLRSPQAPYVASIPHTVQLPHSSISPEAVAQHPPSDGMPRAGGARSQTQHESHRALAAEGAVRAAHSDISVPDHSGLNDIRRTHTAPNGALAWGAAGGNNAVHSQRHGGVARLPNTSHDTAPYLTNSVGGRSLIDSSDSVGGSTGSVPDATEVLSGPPAMQQQRQSQEEHLYVQSMVSGEHVYSLPAAGGGVDTSGHGAARGVSSGGLTPTPIGALSPTYAQPNQQGAQLLYAASSRPQMQAVRAAGSARPAMLGQLSSAGGAQVPPTSQQLRMATEAADPRSRVGSGDAPFTGSFPVDPPRAAGQHTPGYAYYAPQQHPAQGGVSTGMPPQTGPASVDQHYASWRHLVDVGPGVLAPAAAVPGHFGDSQEQHAHYSPVRTDSQMFAGGSTQHAVDSVPLGVHSIQPPSSAPQGGPPQVRLGPQGVQIPTRIVSPRLSFPAARGPVSSSSSGPGVTVQVAAQGGGGSVQLPASSGPMAVIDRDAIQAMVARDAEMQEVPEHDERQNSTNFVSDREQPGSPGGLQNPRDPTVSDLHGASRGGVAGTLLTPSAQSTPMMGTLAEGTTLVTLQPLSMPVIASQTNSAGEGTIAPSTHSSAFVVPATSAAAGAVGGITSAPGIIMGSGFTGMVSVNSGAVALPPRLAHQISSTSLQQREQLGHQDD